MFARFDGLITPVQLNIIALQFIASIDHSSNDATSQVHLKSNVNEQLEEEQGNDMQISSCAFNTKQRPNLFTPPNEHALWELVPPTARIHDCRPNLVVDAHKSLESRSVDQSMQRWRREQGQRWRREDIEVGEIGVERLESRG